MANKAKSIRNCIKSHGEKSCHFWSLTASYHTLQQQNLRLFTNSFNWIHLLELLFSKYVFNSESGLMELHAKNALFSYAWSSQKLMESKESPGCLQNYQWIETRFERLCKQSMGYNKEWHNSAPKVFFFYKKKTTSWQVSLHKDLPCNTARNPEITARGQRMPEQTKPSRKDWAAATRKSEQQREKKS